MKTNVIKESANDQKLLPNELFVGEVERANEFGEGRWEIRRQGSEWTLLALKSYAPGDLVLTSKNISDGPNRTSHTIQTGDEKHVIMNLPCRFLNHCCEPSLGAWDNDCEAFDFIALRHIQKGDELTFDYDTTEFKVENFPEKCLCGVQSCRRTITGYLGSEEIVREKYGKYIARYLKSKK